MADYPLGCRVAAYPRVSTEEQKRTGMSIESQATDLQAWADRQGLKIVGFYNDAGNSARKPYNKRPAMLQLLEDIKSDKIDLVIFTRLDRWFRNVAEYYKVQEILDAHKVQWKAIYEDYDTTTSSGRLKINIMLSVAQDEADRDSERIRSVFETKRQKREPVTGNVPTGYKIVGKKVVKDPATEGAIDCFFQTFLRYRSIERARRAAEEGFGVKLSYTLARSILRKEAYYGCFGGVEGMCPPYITKEQYDEIQASRHKVERRTVKDRTYLFTGLICCAECGRRMGSRTHTYALRSGGHNERVSYSCPGHTFHRGCENHVDMSEKKIEAYLLSHLDEDLQKYTLEVERLASAAPSARNFQEERAKLKKKLTRLKDLYVDDIIDLSLYRKDYEALTSQLDKLAAEEAETMSAKLPDPGKLKKLLFSGWQRMYEGLTREEKQAFWRLALDRIYVHPDRHITISFRL